VHHLAGLDIVGITVERRQPAEADTLCHAVDTLVEGPSKAAAQVCGLAIQDTRRLVEQELGTNIEREAEGPLLHVYQLCGSLG